MALHYIRFQQLFCALFIFSEVCMPMATFASSTTGPNNPGLSAGLGVTGCTNSANWSGTGTPGNGSANDTNYIHEGSATNWDNNETTDELRFSNFGFSIPSGSQILGFTVETLMWASAGSANYTKVQLFSAPGTNVGNNKATGAVPTSDPGTTYTTWGSSSDVWGTTLTADDINASTFGFVICFTASANNSQLDFDHVRITVTYDPPVDTTPSRLMHLFAGFIIKLFSGKLILHQAQH